MSGSIMSKQVKARLKLQIPGGAATPAPPVGSALGPQGVSTMEFCKQFNAATANRKGETVPVEITVYTDRSFSFITKTPPVTELILKRAKISKGAHKPGTETAGEISRSAISEIAQIKFPDLNAYSMEAACKVIEGSARSMGLRVVE